MTRVLPSNRYGQVVGLFYWCDYWKFWDKVISTREFPWVTVQRVDMQGRPVEPERKHCTALRADRFAQFPFTASKETVK